MKRIYLFLFVSILSIAANADDFEVMRSRLREHITLGPTDYDMTNSDTRGYIIDLNNRAQKYQQGMRHDTTVLWNDLNKIHNVAAYTPAQINSSYTRLLDMTRAWAYPGGKLYHNDQLLSDIRYGLGLLYKEAYNENSKKLGNWWEWRIGIPWNYANIVSILYEQLNADEIKQFEKGSANFVRRFVKHGDLTYANQASICRNLLVLGILTNNENDVRSALKYCVPAFVDKTTASERMYAIHKQDRCIGRQKEPLRSVALKDKEGLYADGTFVQHNAIPYIGTYGVEIIQMAGYIADLVPGTKFSVPESITKTLPVWINNAYLPAMYRGEMLLMLMGRANAADPYNNARLAALSIMDAAQLISDSTLQAKAIAAASNTLAHDTHHPTPYSALNPLPVYKPVIDKALANANDQAEESFSVVWAAGDKVIHQTDKWRACVSMSSNRIGKYECFMRASSGNQNSTGWYIGDGMTYLYLPNDTKQYYQYMLNINPYRVPGTTVDLIERKEVQSLQPLYGHRAAARDIARAGGVMLDGKYSSAMMQLLGGASDLKAKKSWFLFDKEVVCLGADISLPDNREVITTVENRRFRHPLLVKANGEAKTINGAKDNATEQVEWACLETIGGYYFPRKAKLFVNQSDRDNTELWLSHGNAPKSATYEYMILPSMSKDDISSYAASPEVEIIANNERVQAVVKKSIGLTAINFWTGGEVSTPSGLKVKSNNIAAIMLQEDGDKLTLCIAEPTWEENRQVIEISGKYKIAETNPDRMIGISTSKDNKTKISINQFHRLGMTQTIKLIKDNK
ncbi:MAG: hypothetical protein IJ834_03550 [Paludibacteraceae bacterium]|nr:hypothetical protein [Paludibacteraceae bacterium]